MSITTRIEPANVQTTFIIDSLSPSDLVNTTECMYVLITSSDNHPRKEKLLRACTCVSYQSPALLFHFTHAPFIVIFTTLTTVPSLLHVKQSSPLRTVPHLQD